MKTFPLPTLSLLFVASIAALSISTKAYASVTLNLTGVSSSSTVTFSWNGGDSFTLASDAQDVPSSALDSNGSFPTRIARVLDDDAGELFSVPWNSLNNDSGTTNGASLAFSSAIPMTVGGSSMDLVGIGLNPDVSVNSDGFGLLFDSSVDILVGTTIAFPVSSGSRTFNLLGSDTFSIFQDGSSTLAGDFPGSVSLAIATVPEPSSFTALAGLAALGFISLRRRQR